MSVEAISAVFEHSKARASGHGLLVLIALADYANSKDGHVAYPSLDKLAQKVRLQKSRLCKILNDLETSGELSREKSSGGRNKRSRYTLTCINSVTGNSVTGETVTDQNGVTGETVCNMETVSRVRHAIRTVIKNKNTEPNGSNSLPHREKKRRSPSPDPIQAEALAEFYEAYPRHVGRAEAEKAWMKLDPNSELRAKIMIGTRRYAEEVQGSEPKYIKHPGPWLNARRWEDEPATNGPKQQQSSMRDIG